MNQQLRLFVDLVLHDRYKIINELGHGGMGAVYEAQDLHHANRRVAIKQMLPRALDLRQAFEREADILSRMDHPQLPRVTDCFEEETGLFMAMQFIPGTNLGQLLGSRKLPFPSQQVQKWAEDLLATVEYLHTRSPRIIHRDIKPTNLKLAPDGRIILLDFGLAREMNDEVPYDATEDLCILAYTPHYAPPEQIQGLATDRFSDIYALGATLYHLLTGVAPIDSLKRINEKRVNSIDPLRPIQQIIRGIPQALSQVIMRALALEPEARPSSAGEMLQHLKSGTITAKFHAQSNALTPKPSVRSQQRPQLKLATPAHTRVNVPVPTTLPLPELPPRLGNVVAYARFQQQQEVREERRKPRRIANIASAILILFTIAGLAHHFSRSAYNPLTLDSGTVILTPGHPPSSKRPTEQELRTRQHRYQNAVYVANAPPLPELVNLDELARYRTRYLRKRTRLKATAAIPSQSFNEPSVF